MGTSDDFEAAIAEGSTMVRVGRALFMNNEERFDGLRLSEKTLKKDWDNEKDARWDSV